MSNFTKANVKKSDKPRLFALQKELLKANNYQGWISEATAITWLLDLADTVKSQATKETNNE